jgi:hypothetical protein
VQESFVVQERKQYFIDRNCSLGNSEQFLQNVMGCQQLNECRLPDPGRMWAFNMETIFALPLNYLRNPGNQLMQKEKQTRLESGDFDDQEKCRLRVISRTDFERMPSSRNPSWNAPCLISELESWQNRRDMPATWPADLAAFRTSYFLSVNVLCADIFA